MFLVTEADADAIRAIFNQEGELSAAIELRRRFPGITDNAKARAHVRTIAGSKPPPSQPCTVTGMRSSIRRGRHTHHHQQPDSPVTALARGAGGSDPMQEEITTPTLGTVRVHVCSRCSGKKGEDYEAVPDLRGVSHLAPDRPLLGVHGLRALGARG